MKSYFFLTRFSRQGRSARPEAPDKHKQRLPNARLAPTLGCSANAVDQRSYGQLAAPTFPSFLAGRQVRAVDHACSKYILVRAKASAHRGDRWERLPGAERPTASFGETPVPAAVTAIASPTSQRSPLPTSAQLPNAT